MTSKSSLCDNREATANLAKTNLHQERKMLKAGDQITITILNPDQNGNYEWTNYGGWIVEDVNLPLVRVNNKDGEVKIVNLSSPTVRGVALGNSFGEMNTGF